MSTITEQETRKVKTHANFREPKNFRLSKTAKCLYALSRDRKAMHEFRNMMVEAESFASTVERVSYDKLVPNVAGFGKVISED